MTRLKARNLYLIQGLSHQEIADQTGLTKQGSEQLAHREGWVAARRERTTRLSQKHDARMAETADEALNAIVAASEQHAVKGLERVGTALEDQSPFAARDFQSWTGGVKNLVSIMREIRAPQEQQPSGSTLNMFVIRVGDAAVPAQAKLEQQVTEVAATPAP